MPRLRGLSRRESGGTTRVRWRGASYLGPSLPRDSARSASTGLLCGRLLVTCGSRRERFGGLAGGRICVVCCVTVYVTSVLITSTVDPSKRYTRSYHAGRLARSSVPAHGKGCGKKSSMGSENRQIFRCNLKSVATHSIPPKRKRVALSNSSIYCGQCFPFTGKQVVNTTFEFF